MLAGILPVTSGKIYFDDDDVTNMPPEKRGIGLVFQNYALYPHMTVLQNICFPLEVQKVPKAERLERAMDIAKLVHVDTMMKRHPAELSGGQQQRVAIARALVKNQMCIRDSLHGGEAHLLFEDLLIGDGGLRRLVAHDRAQLGLHGDARGVGDVANGLGGGDVALQRQA